MTPDELAKSGSEHGEQRALFAFFTAERNAGRYLETTLMFAIPNGGKRDARTAGKLKAEGVKPGVPDIFLPVPRGIYHGLFVELKKKKDGRVSSEQLDFGRAICANSYGFNVCVGWEQARDTICAYLNQ